MGKLLGGGSKLFLFQLKWIKDTNIPLSMELETEKFMNGIHVARELIVDNIKCSITFLNQCSMDKEALVSLKHERNAMMINLKPPKPPDKQIKYVSFSQPPTTETVTITDSDSPTTLFTSQLPFYNFPTNKLADTSLTTMNLHMHESICFKLTAIISDTPVSVLLDTGS
ncbi:hypothetical protein BB561_006535 [Smittium simulii]|uniref:Uncharacterized protein n=1 Tax=Smittium simulii TaxID=133385 RepID=A0A2T9Y390_9FUNG|nr:hypothetical protein BB561_006535 [Smittium simulii]